MPPGSAVLDFELEVGAVIGREGRDLTPEEARDHIVGYTIFNDWSARDLQSAEMTVGLGPCKGKDTATSLGPYLVTADERTPPPLQPGDTITLTVEGIGTLTNTVVPGADPVPLPVGRPGRRARP